MYSKSPVIPNHVPFTSRSFVPLSDSGGGTKVADPRGFSAIDPCFLFGLVGVMRSLWEVPMKDFRAVANLMFMRADQIHSRRPLTNMLIIQYRRSERHRALRDVINLLLSRTLSIFCTTPSTELE